MIEVLVRDNYFDDPDLIRQTGLSLTNYRIDNNLDGMGFGWRGQRTLPIRKIKNYICPCCNQKVDSYSTTDEFLMKHSIKIFNICDDFFGFTKKSTEEMTITSYFHITTEETKSAYPNFLQDRFHKDPHGPVAGVVYLTPNAPKTAGTSVLDGKNNQFTNIENKYNRLVAYEGSRIHALSDTFGDSKDTGRMTFTFFIHTVGDTRYFT